MTSSFIPSAEGRELSRREFVNVLCGEQDGEVEVRQKGVA